MKNKNKIKTVFIIALILIMNYSLSGSLEEIQMNDNETPLNAYDIPRVRYYYTQIMYFSTNYPKSQVSPIYCMENDTLGYYVANEPLNYMNITIYLVNQSNKDLFWSDQNFTAVSTWYAPTKFSFKEVVIPEDDFYFAVGMYYTTSTTSSYIEFDIIHVHYEPEIPIQEPDITNTTNTYVNETYINETYVNETYIDNTYVNETYVNETLISDDKINPIIYLGWGLTIGFVIFSIIFVKIKKKRVIENAKKRL